MNQNYACISCWLRSYYRSW